MCNHGVHSSPCPTGAAQGPFKQGLQQIPAHTAQLGSSPDPDSFSGSQKQKSTFSVMADRVQGKVQIARTSLQWMLPWAAWAFQASDVCSSCGQVPLPPKTHLTRAQRHALAVQRTHARTHACA